MPRIHTAHKFSERSRTDDVLTDEFVDFKSLLLSSDVLKGLSSSGFERPSPIQLKAIPLGRCGLDLIAQAKSGTGKTCVFSVIALESLLLRSNTTQVLILAPTREIAVQIKDVIKAIGSKMDNLVCHVFIGGLPVEDNKKLLKKPCHIAVGTPGRIKYLIENHFLKTESVRLFILDEADKLLEDSFQEQINWIFSSLPSNKQMMAFSATYPEYLAKHLTRYMREPTFVRLNATDPTLQGIKQFYQLVAFHPLPHKTFQEKVSKLLKLLSTLPFNQCLVFSNFQIRAQSLCDTLCLKGWPSVFISGNQTQSQRLKAMEKLKEFKCRVLISTDLTSRGIDAEHVNLVINMDVPRDPETYLHRIGRAGRFGTQGIAVTFAAQGQEQTLFKAMEENIGIAIDELPDPIPQSLCTSETSSGPCSGPVLPGTTTVEVDILKDANTKASEVNQNKPELNTVHNSGRSSDVLLPDGGKIVRLEEQRSGDGSQMKQENLGIVYNQDKRVKSQIRGNVDGDLLSDTVAEEGVTATCIQTKELRACVSSRCDVTTEEEPFDGCIDGTGELQETHSSCNDTSCPPQRNEADDTAGIISEVSSNLQLQCDLMSSNTKTAETQSCSYSVSSAGHLPSITDEILNKFKQDLSFDSLPKLRSSYPGCTPDFFSDAGNERIASQNKDYVDDELTVQLTEERSCTETALKETSLSNHSCSSDDDTEGLNGRGFDAVRSTSKEESNDNNYLPSLQEFERDFDYYLKTFSNMDHCVESSSNSSEVEDEVDEGDIQSDADVHAIDIPSGSLNNTSEDAVQAPHYRGTYNHSLHEEDSTLGTQVKNNSNSKTMTARSATPPQRLYAVPGNCNQFFQHELQDNTFASRGHPCNLYQDDRCYVDCFNKSDSAVNSNLPYGYCDECCVHNGSQNQHHYDDYYHDTRTANWSANGQTQSFVASSQQQFDQSCGDSGCYQNSQWKISWYNAYHRQTICIRQFVAFSRSELRF